MSENWPKGPYFADTKKGEVYALLDPANPTGFHETVCKINSDFCGIEGALAVAHLFAASPGLYAHGQALLDAIWDGLDDNTLPQAARKALIGLSDALAKARGEG